MESTITGNKHELGCNLQLSQAPGGVSDDLAVAGSLALTNSHGYKRQVLWQFEREGLGPSCCSLSSVRLATGQRKVTNVDGSQVRVACFGEISEYTTIVFIYVFTALNLYN